MLTETAMTEERVGQRVFLNAGSGAAGHGRLPPFFDSWRQIRVDVDPSVTPDIVADIADLSFIKSGWSAHCLEHLYIHQVDPALAEFYRVQKEDSCAWLIVPDLQTIAQYIVSDRLHEVIYESQAEFVTAHCVLFGF